MNLTTITLVRRHGNPTKAWGGGLFAIFADTEVCITTALVRKPSSFFSFFFFFVCVFMLFLVGHWVGAVPGGG
jgi:hypothetical protein